MLATHSSNKTKTPAGKPKRDVASPDAGTLVQQNSVWQTLALQSPIIQPKLTISQPDDPYEREADRIAGQVMRAEQPLVQRKCAACSSGGAPCAECEGQRNLLLRKADDDSKAAEAAPADPVSGLDAGQSLD